MSHRVQESLLAKLHQTAAAGRGGWFYRSDPTAFRPFNEFLIYYHRNWSDSKSFLGGFSRVQAQSAGVGPERAAPENWAMKATFTRSRYTLRLQTEGIMMTTTITHFIYMVLFIKTPTHFMSRKNSRRGMKTFNDLKEGRETGDDQSLLAFEKNK